MLFLLEVVDEANYGHTTKLFITLNGCGLCSSNSYWFWFVVPERLRTQLPFGYKSVEEHVVLQTFDRLMIDGAEVIRSNVTNPPHLITDALAGLRFNYTKDEWDR